MHSGHENVAAGEPKASNETVDEHTWCIQAQRPESCDTAAAGRGHAVRGSSSDPPAPCKSLGDPRTFSSLEKVHFEILHPKPRKVLIVGAGWYGCHCAMVCKSLGISFEMVDSANAIMTESSVRNQNRLHLGFHYPRCYKTRRECLVGHPRFMAAYGHLTVAVPRNLYLVSKNSIIDFRTFVHIFRHEETQLVEVLNANQAGMPFKWLPEHYGGCVFTDERMIDCDKVAHFFRQELAAHLLPDYEPGDVDTRSSPCAVSFKSSTYDLALDCTYGQMEPPESGSVFELCCSWVYKFKRPVPSSELFGFTVMDGPFFSIFPFKPDKNLFTLTHVTYTPLLRSSKIADIRQVMSGAIVADKVKDRHSKALAHVLESLPSFCHDFEYNGHFLSIKCKSDIQDDDRSLRVRESSNMISFCGGKITGIFSMEDYLLRKFAPMILPVDEVPLTSLVQVSVQQIQPGIGRKVLVDASSEGAPGQASKLAD